jgi:hypothetical protein
LPHDKLKDILDDASKMFSLPDGLLQDIIEEEHLRLYQLRRRFINEDIDAIFEKHSEL